MQPTVGRVFVETVKKNSKLEKFVTVDSQEAKYQVTAVADDVTRCKVGDFVLFTDVKQYQFEGKQIFVVLESDIVSVKTNSEIKK